MDKSHTADIETLIASQKKHWLIAQALAPHFEIHSSEVKNDRYQLMIHSELDHDMGGQTLIDGVLTLSFRYNTYTGPRLAIYSTSDYSIPVDFTEIHLQRL